MKPLLKISIFASCFVSITLNAQISQSLNILIDSPASVQINWANEVGTTYRLLSTPSLNSPIVWSPLEDAFSSDTNVIVEIPSTNIPYEFFRTVVPTNNGVSIFAPTNGQNVSGIIALRAGAQIGSQVQGVNLFLDGAQVGYVDSGGVEFDLDTTHFTNGNHTLYVSAVDTGNNQTLSSSITLNFSNRVRWLDADSLFQSYVPIGVQSDIYPATWTVFVEDINGTTVRTFSGSTSNGNISTNWDGNDNSGVYAPDQTGYSITVVVSSSDSSPLLASSLSTGSSMTQTIPVQNQYGATDYLTVQQAPDPSLVYQQQLRQYYALPKNLRFLYPPLTPPSADSTRLMTTNRVSARQMLLSQQRGSNGGIQPMTGGGGGGGATQTLLWREAAWSSGETVICRQKILNFTGLLWDATAANLCNNIENLISLADSGGRGVYQNSVMLMQHNGDFNAVKGALASGNPNTRAFYFYGHGGRDGNSIGFREGTPSDGITVTDLRSLLGNMYKPYRHGAPSSFFTSTKPFSFVFLDGCMTGTGSMPEAFGIPKVFTGQAYTTYHKHQRAFMGWGGTISLSILDNDSLNWSSRFFTVWLGNTSSTLQNAINDAWAHYPSAGDGAPLMVYGSHTLTWGE